MALDFDTSRAARRPLELRHLVDAVLGANAGEETDWLEWKSSLDLRSKEGQAHVARCILGFANRMPADALRTVEGHAYMVVGAEPGNAPGVNEVDSVELDRWLTAYLGADGPRWHPQWVSVDGRQVLVVAVDAPRDGDPIFAAQREGLKLMDGAVLVRRRGRTEPASSANLRQLQQRLLAGSSSVTVDVEVASGVPLEPVGHPREEVANWLARQRDELLAPMRRATAPRPPSKGVELSRLAGKSSGLSISAIEELESKQAAGEPLTAAEQADLAATNATVAKALSGPAALMAAGLMQREDRTPQQFEGEVDAYLEECSRVMPATLLFAAGQLLTPVVMTLVNSSDANLTDVAVHAHVEGDVLSTLPREYALDNERLPAPPRRWGPYRTTLFGPGYDLGGLLRHAVPATPAPPRPRIDNGGSTDIEFPPVHLRPLQRVALDPIVLWVPAALQEVRLNWTATSTAVNGVARGSVHLPVGGDPVTFDDLMAGEADFDDEG